MKSRHALTLAALGMFLMMPACAGINQPASVGGLSEVFHDPGFAVQGKTRKDQRWISETQETGIRVLGWKRPPKFRQPKPMPVKATIIREQPEPAVPTPAPAPKRRWWQR